MLGSRLQKGAKAGQKLLLVADKPGMLSDAAAAVYAPEGKAAVLADRKLADALAAAEKPVILFDRSRLTREVAQGVAALAQKGGVPVLQLVARANSQTVRALGISRNMADLTADIEAGKLKGVLLFGVDVPAELVENLEFVLEADASYGRAYPYASALLPLSGFGAVTGSYVNFEGRLQKVEAAIAPYQGRENWQIVADLINALNRTYRFEDLQTVREGLAAACPAYRTALLGDGAYVGEGGEQPKTPEGGNVPDIDGDAEFAREYEQASTAVRSWRQMKH